MVIVSISVPEEQLAELDRAMELSGHTGRSAFLRESMNHFLSDLSSEDSLKGSQTVLIIVSHDHDGPSFTVFRHSHAGIIRTHLHQDANKRCHEILLVEGDSSKIKDFIDDARKRTFEVRLYPLP